MEIMEILSMFVSGLLIVIKLGICLVLVYLRVRDRKPANEISANAKIIIANNLESQAECAHEIWSHWTAYQFSICEKDKHGNIVIPKEKADRWERLSQTRYNDLTEQEKKSDRVIAKEFIHPMLEEHLKDL